jgi:hypothetical protein
MPEVPNRRTRHTCPMSPAKSHLSFNHADVVTAVYNTHATVAIAKGLVELFTEQRPTTTEAVDTGQ